MSPTNEEVLPVSLFIEFFPFYAANTRSLWKQNEIKSEWDKHRFLEEIALLDMLLVWNCCYQQREYKYVLFHFYYHAQSSQVSLCDVQGHCFVFFPELSYYVLNEYKLYGVHEKKPDRLKRPPQGASLKWMVCVPTLICRGFKHGMIHEGEWWLDL